MTVGQRLHAAREANGMSIGDVARRTYIQPKFIQAIEEDNLAVIPESHRRLFVREFAKSVGERPDELLALLPEQAPPPLPIAVQAIPETVRPIVSTPPSQVPPVPDEERKVYSDFLKRLSNEGGIKLGNSKLSIWLIGSAVLLLLLVAIYYLFLRPEHSTTAGRKSKVDSAGSPTQVLSRGPADTNAEAGDAPPAAATPAAGDSLTLEGKATSKIWFAIVMDGKRSETGTLDSGSVKVWRATQHFKLSLGNAGGLQLSLNDKSIGTLGPARTSVRNQIIDASGVRRLTAPHRPAAPESAAVPNGAHPATPRSSAPHSGTSRSGAGHHPTRQHGGALPRIITPTELRTTPPQR
ncbi:MAG: DUF4115 domain-containing protein [Bacteroidetes bacterium]|nr:DUF4115 domain-containing protein [Bacteroidota bacterium]